MVCFHIQVTVSMKTPWNVFSFNSMSSELSMYFISLQDMFVSIRLCNIVACWGSLVWNNKLIRGRYYYVLL